MRNISVRIGMALLLLGTACAILPPTAGAMDSASWSLQDTSMNAATMGGATAPSYALEDGALTWNQAPLVSATYQLQPSTAAADAAAASSAGTTSGGGGGGSSARPPSGRRPRPSSSSTSSVTSIATSAPSSQIASSRSSAISRSAESSSASSADPATSAFSSIGYGGPSTPVQDQHDEGFSEADMMPSHEKERRFFDVVEHICDTEDMLHEAAPSAPDGGTPWITLIIAIMILGTAWMDERRKKSRQSRKHSVAIFLIAVVFTGAIHGSMIDHVTAARTVPATSAYNGRLLTSGGAAVTTPVSIRFSYWTSSDKVDGDIDGAGAINTGATTYADWHEVVTVTPNANGYFSVQLGENTALPDFSTMAASDLLSLYLQVEVKASSAADTAYEILDADSTDPTVDRSGILSVPFAENANMIDQREIGTASGSIALLGSGGVFPTSVIPGGTTAGTFSIDSDDSESGTVTLRFGTTLSKTLAYSISAGAFIFNDDVEIQGNLTVSGLVNGIDVTNLGSSTGALRATNGGGLTLRVSHGGYRLGNTLTYFDGDTIGMTANAMNYVFFGSGGLTANTTGFPTDESMIPVAEVTTDGSAITGIVDRRVLQTDTREETVTVSLQPSFDKTSFQGDGSSNVGQLSLQHDDSARKNFYQWTSTQAALQDYDLLVHIPLPNGFVRWQQTADTNPVSFQYRTTSMSALSSAIDLQITDTNGVPVTLSGSVTGLSSTSWAETGVEYTGTPTWTAGQTMMVRIRGFAKNGEQAHIGSLQLRYVTMEE